MHFKHNPLSSSVCAEKCPVDARIAAVFLRESGQGMEVLPDVVLARTTSPVAEGVAQGKGRELLKKRQRARSDGPSDIGQVDIVFKQASRHRPHSRRSKAKS